MATSNLHDKIYKLLAKKLNKPVDVIEKACRSQSEFTANTIESGSKYSVRWKYLGIFGVKKRRQEHLDGNKEQEANKQEPNSEQDPIE
jgi:hypothetical protein